MGETSSEVRSSFFMIDDTLKREQHKIKGKHSFPSKTLLLRFEVIRQICCIEQNKQKECFLSLAFFISHLTVFFSKHQLYRKNQVRLDYFLSTIFVLKEFMFANFFHHIYKFHVGCVNPLFDTRHQLKYNMQPNWSNQIITVYLTGQFKP